MADIAALYGNPRSTTVSAIRIDSHTMGKAALKRYVAGKFTKDQQQLLEGALLQGLSVEVHGIFSEHVPHVFGQLDLTVRQSLSRPPRDGKVFNNRRPTLFLCERKGESLLVFCVVPSREYVDQNAELAALWLQFRAAGAYRATRKRAREARLVVPNVRVVHYPNCEDKFVEWSGFNRGVGDAVRSGDVCVIGEVELVSEFLLEQEFPANEAFTFFGEQSMFGYRVHQSPRTNRRILLVGCRESFWGSAAGHIAGAIADAGAGHVIYAAKCGTFVGQKQVHAIVCPHSYALATYRPGMHEHRSSMLESAPSSTIKSNHKRIFVNGLSGVHLTVPTVIGETRQQRAAYVKLQPATIDNEVHHIAVAVHSSSVRTHSNVEFTALLFNTDYVTDGSRTARYAKVNLSHKGQEIHRVKRDRFRAITLIIGNHAEHYGAVSDESIRQLDIIASVSSWGRIKSILKGLSDGVRVDPRLHVQMVLDSWIAGFYYNDLDELKRLLKAVEQRPLPTAMHHAVAAASEACDIMNGLILRPLSKPSERRALCARAVARLDELLGHGEPSMTTVVCRDLIAMAILTVWDNDPIQVQLAENHLNTALVELQRVAAPPVTAQIWECFLRKYLGKVYKLGGLTEAAYREFYKAESKWSTLLTGLDERATWPRLLLESERAIARLACVALNPSQAPGSWRGAVEEHVREAEEAFAPIRAVKAQYEALRVKNSWSSRPPRE